jgi:hypothetical protein
VKIEKVIFENKSKLKEKGDKMSKKAHNQINAINSAQNESSISAHQ